MGRRVPEVGRVTSWVRFVLLGLLVSLPLRDARAAAKPRLTIVEEFFSSDPILYKSGVRLNYDAIKKYLATPPHDWIVSLQTNAPANKVMALAQGTDVLLLVGHGNTTDVVPSAGENFLRLCNPRDIFTGFTGPATTPADGRENRTGLWPGFKLYAHEIEKRLTDRAGPRLTIAQFCVSAPNETMPHAFGGCFIGYQYLTDIANLQEGTRTPGKERNPGGEGDSFVFDLLKAYANGESRCAGAETDECRQKQAQEAFDEAIRKQFPQAGLEQVDRRGRIPGTPRLWVSRRRKVRSIPGPTLLYDPETKTLKPVGR